MSETNVIISPKYPLWLRDVAAAIPITSQFVLYGQVRDFVLRFSDDGELTGRMNLVGAIWSVLDAYGFDGLVTYDVVNHITVHTKTGTDSPKAKELESRITQYIKTHGEGSRPGTGAPSVEWFSNIDKIVDMIGTVNVQSEQEMPKLALLVDYYSQVSEVNDTAPHIERLELASLMHVHKAIDFPFGRQQIKHPVFWVVEKADDLPEWMLRGDGIRQVPVPMPDLSLRMEATRALLDLELLRKEGMGEDEFSAAVEKAVLQTAKATDGITIRGIMEILKFAPEGDVLTPEDIAEAVRRYRIGLSENPWQKEALHGLLRTGSDFLNGRVLGQQSAVRKALDILIRSSMNLTSAYSREKGTKPRGVLFFSGPTGVGKTELAKSMTELIFGTQDAYIRFDMSEFSMEHSDQRLIGPPPGYIGFGSGGELTNAVKQRPFSLILFDEIEKASPEIFKLFLQILDDARLTGANGETVFFNETIIIFTSNVGFTSDLGVELVVLPRDESNEEYQRYAADIQDRVKDLFENVIGHPELFGRLGENNIVAFNPISRTTAEVIAAQHLERILENIFAEHHKRVVLTDDAMRQLLDYATEDMSMGARAIDTKLEKYLINPVARVLFDYMDIDEFVIEGIESDADGAASLVIPGLNEQRT